MATTTESALRRAALPLVLSCLFTATARADNIDVNNLMKAKLTPKLATIYQQKVGGAMPAGTTAAVAFKGTLTHQGINFTMPSTIPANPKILQQNTLSNCNTLESSQHVSVNKTTTQTESWSTTDTVSAEVSVTVSYDTPVGVGVEGTATAGYSREWNKGGEKSQSLTWEAGAEVPVAPGRQVKVQFVVDEQKLDIPYRVDFVATGPTQVTFTTPASGTAGTASWGAQMGNNAVDGGQESNGTKLYVCRAKHSNNYHAGKVVAGKCNIGYGGDEERKSTFEYLHAANYEWVSGVGSNPVSAGTENGQERYVCKASAHGGTHPGKVVGTSCNIGYGGKEERHSSFMTLNLKKQTPGKTTPVQINIEDQLSGPERTMTLRGMYRGVSAVQGDFRVDTPKTLECAPQMQQASAAAPSSATRSNAPAAASAAIKAPPPVQAASASELQSAMALPKTASITRSPIKPKKVGAGK